MASNIQRGIDSYVSSCEVMEKEMMHLLSGSKVTVPHARLIKIQKNGQSIADYVPLDKRFMFYQTPGSAFKMRLVHLYNIRLFINGFTYRNENATKLKEIIEKNLNIEIEGFLI